MTRTTRHLLLRVLAAVACVHVACLSRAVWRGRGRALRWEARLRWFYRSHWAWLLIALIYSFGFRLMYLATH